MRLRALTLAAVATCTLPTTTFAQGPATAANPTAVGGGAVKTERVFVGSCVSAIANENESAFLGTLAAAVIPGLISKGLDAVGNALTRMAEEKKTPVTATTVVELSAPTDSKPTCVQFVRGELVPTPSLLPQGSEANYNATFELQEQGRLKDAGIFLKGAPDLFVEYWIRRSEDEGSASFTPTRLVYSAPLEGKADKKGKGKARGLAGTLSVNLMNVDGSEKKVVQNASFLIGDYTPGANIDFLGAPQDLKSVCDRGCFRASQWVANPLPRRAATPPVAAPTAPAAPAGPVVPGAGAGAGPKPVASNWSFTVTETRYPSEFFKLVASVYTAAKPTLKSELEQVLVEQKREEAEVKSLEDAATATADLGVKLADASAKLGAYCSASTASTPAGAMARRAAAAALNAAQGKANASAAKAGEVAPFPTLVAISDAKNASLCL